MPHPEADGPAWAAAAQRYGQTGAGRFRGPTGQRRDGRGNTGSGDAWRVYAYETNGTTYSGNTSSRGQYGIECAPAPPGHAPGVPLAPPG